MMKRLTLFLLFLLPPSLLATATIEQLVGAWSCGDGKGYCLLLTLDRSGDFAATWRACRGEMGSAKGKWRIDGTHLVLTPEKEDGLMVHHLTTLEVLEDRDGIALFRRTKISREGSPMFTFRKRVAD